MSLNILVVDDSGVMRTMIARILNMTGLDIGEVHEASNGQEGLAALAEHWIDIVMVDINMPVMDGEEMIRRMRADEQTRDMPVIVVSTEGSRTRVERLQLSGARFIHKPFSAEAVRDTIMNLTGISHESAF
jgi:two-component system, chemotaxis family, chemotaxis protein CheY